MNKIILLLIVISMGLSVQAFDWTSLLYQPAQPYSSYQQYPTYQSYVPNQAIQNAQNIDYSATQAYGQPYSQAYYQNPYQIQNQGQYINPYLNRRPYGYRNNLPYNVVPALSTTTTGTNSVAKSLGQSMLYSMLRGY